VLALGYFFLFFFVLCFVSSEQKMQAFQFSLPSINHEISPTLMADDVNDDENEDNGNEDEEVYVDYTFRFVCK
jgi:hypothetical protein